MHYELEVMNQERKSLPEGRCIELNLKGQPCGAKAVQGRDRCYTHGLFHALNDARCSIDIPLLEDENSILFVYSQVARALAQGAMPAVNATGIIRCCRGAQRLLEEKRREQKRAARTQHPAPGTQSPAPGTQHPDPQPHQNQPLATPPTVFENSESAPEAVPASPQEPIAVESPNSEPADTAPDSPMPDPQPNALDAAAENQSAEEPDPQPWTLAPDKKPVPPPQFADARNKFDDALARMEGKMLTAVLDRNREVRARGGHSKQGVICNIREQGF